MHDRICPNDSDAIHALLYGPSPTKRPNSDLSLMGCATFGGSRLYTPRRDVLPHRCVNADVLTGLSRRSYGTEILHCRIIPAERPDSIAENSPSQRPDFAASWRDVPLLKSKCESKSIIGISPSRRLNPELGFSPFGDETYRYHFGTNNHTGTTRQTKFQRS